MSTRCQYLSTNKIVIREVFCIGMRFSAENDFYRIISSCMYLDVCIQRAADWEAQNLNWRDINSLAHSSTWR